MKIQVQPSAAARVSSASSSVCLSPAVVHPRRAAAPAASLGLAPARSGPTSARADSAIARRLLWAFSLLLGVGPQPLP
jgi:hypothetical protein